MEEQMKGLLSKIKSTLSIIYANVLWVTKPLSANQTPKSLPPSHDRHLQLGLGSLICSTFQNSNCGATIIHSHMISSTSSSSSSSSSSFWRSISSSSSFEIGDLIGTESGVCMTSNEDIVMEKIKPYTYNSTQRKRNQQTRTKKEYPPPIPSLARTENLTGRMPWIFTRHYIDGRLILKKEKVKHYEYFESHRENGRLILKLIPLDDTFQCCHSGHEEGRKDQEQEKVEIINEDGKENLDKDDKGKESTNIILASSVPEPWVENLKKNEGAILRRCFTYAGKEISSNSSFFRMPIPVNKQIRI